MKIVYSDKKTGKTAQAEVLKDREAMLIGKRIGDEVDGSAIDLPGFKLKITGMSDKSGIPSRPEIEGTAKRYILAAKSKLKSNRGMRVRRLVRGNAISTDTEQVNTVITEYGQKPLEELFKPKEKKAE
ncbi:MAG: 30S ribosomal protein S6e [Candidatus Micrarchaeia archaeon]